MRPLRITAYLLCALFVVLVFLTIQTLDMRLFIASLVIQAAMILTASASDRSDKK